MTLSPYVLFPCLLDAARRYHSAMNRRDLLLSPVLRQGSGSFPVRRKRRLAFRYLPTEPDDLHVHQVYVPQVLISWKGVTSRMPSWIHIISSST